jgi:ferrous iron transport protein A
VTLDQLSVGERATIVSIQGEGPFRRRLLEFGLTAGTCIERTGQSPFQDPLAFSVRNTLLTLRRTDAQRIEVQKK